jgi:hypothetical protein
VQEIDEAIVGERRDHQASDPLQCLLGIEGAGESLAYLGQKALARLDPLGVVDIRRRPKPFDDLPHRIAHRHRSTEEPAIATIGGSQSQLALERFAIAERFSPTVQYGG